MLAKVVTLMTGNLELLGLDVSAGACYPDILLWVSSVPPVKCWDNTFSQTIISFLRILSNSFNPLKPELNPICYLLALLAQHVLHVSRIRVKSLTLR